MQGGVDVEDVWRKGRDSERPIEGEGTRGGNGEARGRVWAATERG